MDREAFFAHLRKRNSGVFGTSLSQAQVDTCSAVLDECDARGLTNPEVAYILATAYHEAKMVPNRENLFYTTAARIAAVWPRRFTTQTAQAFTRNPRKLANAVYNGRLGNRENTDDGWIYRGGGLDHLTGRGNYRVASSVVGVDLVAEPHRIIESKIAVESLVHGMLTGRYRGHKLSEYIKHGAVNFVGARAIVNADVKANGERVAGYARVFLSALELAGRPYDPRPEPVIPPAMQVQRTLWAVIADLLKGWKK